MKYRLYTEDVANGLTDFNDDKYTILESKTVEGCLVALVYDEYQFIIANGLKYHEYGSIDWDYGNYYTNAIDAVEKYKEVTEGTTTPVLILDRDSCSPDDVFFVINIVDYNYSDIGIALSEARERYENDNENEMLLDEIILEELNAANIKYEFTGFEQEWV